MARRTVTYNLSGIERLPNDKPVVYRILTEGGKTNYVGVAKRGRVQERLQEHLLAAEIPGARVQIQQMPSIEQADATEGRIIARSGPKYNDKSS